jgi:ubiquinone/menaquinone biosynthesis C-methylase UbiE
MINEIILEKIEKKEPIKIELGCGNQKPEGFIGIDMFPLDGVDIVANIENGLDFIPDNSVDLISSRHFLEHVTNYEQLLREIFRVLKPNGIHRAIVPYFANPHYYSDYTHKQTFGIYSFDYFATTESQLKRKVPAFYNDLKFEITKRELYFRSQFMIRHFLKRIPQVVFNLSDYMKELYEESYCYLIPCSEILFEMKPKK